LSKSGQPNSVGQVRNKLHYH